jgi:hypothetical protein
LRKKIMVGHRVGRPRYKKGLYDLAKRAVMKAAIREGAKYAARRLRGTKKRNNAEVDEGRSGNINASVTDARSGRYIKSRIKRRRKPKLSLKKRIAKLEKESDEGRAVVRKNTINSFQMSSLINTCDYTSVVLMQKTDIGLGIVDQQHIPDAGGNPVTFPSFPESIPVNVYMKMRFEIKNNYLQPVQLQVYEFTCSSDSAITPVDYASGILNEYSQGSVTNFVTAVQYDFGSTYIKGAMKKYWKKTAYNKYLLRAGDTLNVSFSTFWKGNESQFQMLQDNYVKGTTKFVVFRLQGEVANSDASVVYDISKLDVIRHTETVYSGEMDGAPKIIQRVFNLPAAVAADQAGPNVAVQ